MTGQQTRPAPDLPSGLARPAGAGRGRWVPGAAPATGNELTDLDPGWPRRYDDLAGRIRAALGWRVLQLEHVGSIAVPGAGGQARH